MTGACGVAVNLPNPPDRSTRCSRLPSDSLVGSRFRTASPGASAASSRAPARRRADAWSGGALGDRDVNENGRVDGQDGRLRGRYVDVRV